MSNRPKLKGGKRKPHQKKYPETPQKLVGSILDNMTDGNEYGSIVSLIPKPGVDIISEMVKGLGKIEKLRGNPCICYIGNVVHANVNSGIDATDDLPFAEMVTSVDPAAKEVDVILATNGGSGHQTSRFVNNLRQRFDKVNFLLPSFCMSAGTLFALSGDSIWMTERACLGPIDPQIPSKDGRFVPAQALLLLVQQIQKEGQKALGKNQPVPWSAVRIIDSIDKKELADAVSASNYSVIMATEFLINYKLKSWTTHHSTGQNVTKDDRDARARKIAEALASHDKWKSHGHAISREILWKEIKLLIKHPKDDLEKELTRFWALMNWIFDKTPALKLIVSNNYRYVRNQVAQGGGKL